MHDTRLIAIAQCEKCDRFARVLPIEILPRKIYGIQVIESALRFYEFNVNSLRKAASQLPTKGERYLWHTTLHRWSIGLAEKVLDRHQEVQRLYPPPTAALLAEASKKDGLNMRVLFFAITLFVAPAKYHTNRRKDQLEAIGRLLTLATRAYAGESPLMSWALEAINSFHVVAWDFPCFYSVTCLRHAHPP